MQGVTLNNNNDLGIWEFQCSVKKFALLIFNQKAIFRYPGPQ
jgi:hypothetical protein